MWSDEARAAALAARKMNGPGSKDLGRVDSGGMWNMRQAADGSVQATHDNGTVYSGSMGDVHEKMGQYGLNQAMIRAGAAPDPGNVAAGAALAQGRPKGKGLVGIHSASAISRGMTKVRLAFHNSMG